MKNKLSFKPSRTPSWGVGSSKRITKKLALTGATKSDTLDDVVGTGGTKPSVNTGTFDNIFEGDFNSMSCPELASSISQMQSAMETIKVDATTFTYYSGQLASAQSIYNSKCGNKDVTVPPVLPPGNSTTTTGGGSSSGGGGGGIVVAGTDPNNLTTLLPVLTPMYYPPSNNLSSKPGGGGGGGGGSTDPEKKKFNWWIVVAGVLILGSAYFTNKKAA